MCSFMMKDSGKDYRKEILSGLSVKLHRRLIKYGQTKISRRIALKATELYRNYEKTNADLHIKQQINEAAGRLAELGYITIERLSYSDDIIKLYLIEEKFHDIECYLEQHYGITARHYLITELRQLMTDYQHKGQLTAFYCAKLNDFIENSVAEIDIKREQELLAMLAFIQSNDKVFYVREVSMLVYGTSKYFEDYRYDAICKIIKEAVAEAGRFPFFNDNILEEYHIFNVEQELCIKGDFIIELEGDTLKTKMLRGGISLSSKDIPAIKRITANTSNILTIENKTAFYRFEHGDYSTMYLGGYAGQYQILFLKKLYMDNPGLSYHHFGDIDVGGLLIHRHLCNMTAIKFQLFCMGVQELNALEYKHCLQELTEHDIERMAGLKDDPIYQEVAGEMLRRKVKLEQEIVCCTQF